MSARQKPIKTYKVWFRDGSAQTFTAAGANVSIEANCLLVFHGPNSYERKIVAAFSAGQWRSVVELTAAPNEPSSEEAPAAPTSQSQK